MIENNSAGGEKDLNEARQVTNLTRIRKRRVALLVGFIGTGFHGSQINPNVATIESALLEAIHRAGGIADSNAMNPGKVGLTRCSRTDKGVHALRMMFSLKILIEWEKKLDMVKRINSHLPGSVLVYGLQRVTASFHAKNHSKKRTYEYLMPASVLFKERENVDIPERGAVVEEFSRILNRLVGPKNFHNYTSKKSSGDPSCVRYITSFEALTDILEYDDIEFVLLKVSGQSFLLNQIRKMIGTALAVFFGFGTVDTLRVSFGKDKMALPKAPANGLYLADVDYSFYTRKHSEYGDLRFSEEQTNVDAFRVLIHRKIAEIEKAEGIFVDWVSALFEHKEEWFQEPVHFRRETAEEASKD